MRVMWEAPGEWLGASAIVDPVSRERGVHHRTVRTLLSRLVKKGVVETRPEGAGYQYKAKISRDAAVKRESRTFLSRVFDGDAAPALVHLLSESRDQLSAEQIEELK